MPTSDKLEEARFFLSRLESSDPSTADFQHYLSAFLAASASVPDWLLYDYATKYLGLSQKEYITHREFSLVARAMENSHAERFIIWWKKEFKKLRNQGSGKILFEKRRTVIHRGKLLFVLTHQPLYAESVVSPQLRPFPSSGTIAPSAPLHQVPIPDVQSRKEAYFSDYPSEMVISLCRQFFNAVENFVQTAQNSFT